MKPVQYFDDEYLARCRNASPLQIAEFLEQFRLMQGATVVSNPKSKLISIKIPQDMLTAFRAKCKLEDVKYQTQIKQLMRDWLNLDSRV